MNQIETLQAELNEIVEGLTGPVAVLLEGRDTAGKSSTIRETTHYAHESLFCSFEQKAKQAHHEKLAFLLGAQNAARESDCFL